MTAPFMESNHLNGNPGFPASGHGQEQINYHGAQFPQLQRRRNTHSLPPSRVTVGGSNETKVSGEAEMPHGEQKWPLTN